MKYSSKDTFKKANKFGTGIYNIMFAKNMTGKTYMKPLTMTKGMMLANVSFEPGARCFWHIHRATRGGGQIIVCTAGEGWYQEEGKEPITLKPGTVVNIPTNLLHWHGAKKDSWCSHIAIEIGGENIKNEFVRPVTEEEYNNLPNLESNTDTLDSSNFDNANVFGKGVPNTMFAQYFKGESYLNPLTNPKEGTGVFLANVTFEPGCRNNWHVHKSNESGGQILICTAGEGWYQEYGKKARSLKPGDIVKIPANVKHWHGAKVDSWFSHISIEVPGENTSTEWLESVRDEEYNKL